MYKRDEPPHSDEEFHRRRHQDDTDMISPPFSTFEYFERVPTCFEAGRFQRVQADGNELSVRTVSASLLTRLSLYGPNSGIIGAFVVLLAVVV